ncbi:MAG: PQQ-binding-like beta-propeller repeat protein [Bacteroidota bacterium]|nr:PQQ-binding-like beta-propeller repeat protein [Bacteroidota bacterium]
MKKYSKYILVFISFLLLAGCSSDISIKNATYGEPSYKMFGRTPERNFYVSQSIGDSIRLKWSADIHGSFGNTSITAMQKYIFAPDLSGRIYVFNIENGKELGEVKYKGAINTTALIDHLRIIFPVMEFKEPKTTIYNYNFQTAKHTSEIEVEGNVRSEIVNIGEDILFVTEQGNAYRYSLTNEKIWEYASKNFIHSIPVLYNDAYIFGNDKGEIISINAQTGKVNYAKKTGSGFECGFSVSDNILYCADNSGMIYAVDISSGETIWKFNSKYKITLTPAADKEFLYVGNLRGEIYKLDKKTGRFQWKVSTNGIIDTTPIVFDDNLLQPDLNKKLHFIDKKTGVIVKTMSLENRAKLSPVFYENMLFLGIDNGKLLAFEKFQ